MSVFAKAKKKKLKENNYPHIPALAETLNCPHNPRRGFRRLKTKLLKNSLVFLM